MNMSDHGTAKKGTAGGGKIGTGWGKAGNLSLGLESPTGNPTYYKKKEESSPESAREKGAKDPCFSSIHR